jgi:hypothetical protein
MSRELPQTQPLLRTDSLAQNCPVACGGQGQGTRNHATCRHKLARAVGPADRARARTFNKPDNAQVLAPAMPAALRSVPPADTATDRWCNEACSSVLLCLLGAAANSE